MATSHPKVSKALRFEILRRDNFRCHYCGTEATQTELHVDHVVPQSLGGTNDPSNLVTACAECNSGKAGRTLDEPVLAAVDEKSQRYATAVEQAIAERRQVLTTEQQTKNLFRAEWNRWEPAEPLPAGFAESVRQFMRAGLDWEDIVDSIEVAMSRHDIRGREHGRFKYFCGVCNRKIEDIRKRADEIMGETNVAGGDTGDTVIITHEQYEFACTVGDYWERLTQQRGHLAADGRVEQLASLYSLGLDTHSARLIMRQVAAADIQEHHLWTAFIATCSLFLEVNSGRTVEEVFPSAPH